MSKPVTHGGWTESSHLHSSGAPTTPLKPPADERQNSGDKVRDSGGDKIFRFCLPVCLSSAANRQTVSTAGDCRGDCLHPRRQKFNMLNFLSLVSRLVARLQVIVARLRVIVSRVRWIEDKRQTRIGRIANQQPRHSHMTSV